MDDTASRRALKAQYRQRRPDAGVYRILNTQNGKSLIGTAANLDAYRNRLQFARSMGSTRAFDGRLEADVREFGLDAFVFEVLEVIHPEPDQTRAELLDDLALHEALWRERFTGQPLY